MIIRMLHINFIEGIITRHITLVIVHFFVYLRNFIRFKNDNNDNRRIERQQIPANARSVKTNWSGILE